MIGDEKLHDLGPGLIQCLIPYAGGKVLFYLHFFTLCHFLDLSLFLLDLFLAFFEGHLVDLVDEHEDVCVFVVLLDAAKGELPVLKALFQSLPVVFNLEHVDEDLHSSEDRLFLD